MTHNASFAERDQGFQSWLAMNDLLVEEFLDFIVPDMPAEPFSQDGLLAAGHEALRRFSTAQDVTAEANRHVYDLFVRYVGETFVRAAGMEWTCHPIVDSGKAYVGVKLPGLQESIEIPTLITAAVARQEPGMWAKVLGYNLRDREQH